MALFDITIPNPHPGYQNIKVAQYAEEARIQKGLEALWLRYEPYADSDFREEFGRQPDSRFWEMYLTVRFLNTRKELFLRSELTAARRNAGPDICIRKCSRRIWIEAIAPGQGDDVSNLDRVPDLFSAGGLPIRG